MFSRDHLLALPNCQTTASLTERKQKIDQPSGLDLNASSVHNECQVQLTVQMLRQP